MYQHENVFTGATKLNIFLSNSSFACQMSLVPHDSMVDAPTRRVVVETSERRKPRGGRGRDGRGFLVH